MLEPGGHAGLLELARGDLLEAVDFVVDDLADHPEVAGLFLVGDLEEQLLGPLGEFVAAAFTFVDPGTDLVAGVEQAPEEGVLLDDLRVMAGVARGRHLGGQLRHVVLAAGLFDLAGRGQRLVHAQLVAGLVRAVELEHHRVDHTVAVEIEIPGLQPDVIDYAVDRRIADQHRAEDGFLGFDVLRWYLGAYFSSATIVLTDAMAPFATSTSIM